MEKILEGLSVEIGKKDYTYLMRSNEIFKSNFFEKFLILWFNIFSKIKSGEVQYPILIGVPLFILFPILYPFIYSTIISTIHSQVKLIHHEAIMTLKDIVLFHCSGKDPLEGNLVISGKVEVDR